MQNKNENHFIYKYQNILFHLALIAISAVFLLVFSLWTSPLRPSWYGCDASFFTMAGRGITTGWIPYEDFFDLKGPYFFFIQALGQLICKGRTGAYIVQVTTLYAALLLMHKTVRMFISSKKATFIVGLFLLFHVATLWGGNTLEEYMLPLSLLSIYLALRDLSNNGTASMSEGSIKPLSSVIIGICFSIILFSKVTVAAPIIGLVIAVIIYMIKNRRYFNLVSFLIYAFLGVLLGILPIFIYFSLNHALSDMLYSVFIFAFKRSIDFDQKFNIKWELKISGCYFGIIFALFNIIKPLSNSALMALSERKRKATDFLLILIICVGSVTAFVLHFGDPFIYYFTTVFPTIMLTFVALFIIYDPATIFRYKRLDIPLIFFLITLCYFASHSANTLNTVIYHDEDEYHKSYEAQALEMASLIPAADRNSVYSLNMDMQWFEITDILPCYSYTINLQFFVALDNRIEGNIIDKLNTDPPKWIVIGGDLSSYLPNINEVVCKKYTNVYSNDYGSLYLLD